MQTIRKHFSDHSPLYLIAGVIAFLAIGTAFFALAGLGSYAHIELPRL
jgi:hypothetical protein